MVDERLPVTPLMTESHRLHRIHPVDSDLLSIAAVIRRVGASRLRAWRYDLTVNAVLPDIKTDRRES
jgi:hypothetical protein